MEEERTKLMLKRASESAFGILKVGDEIETRKLSQIGDSYKYKVVHIDDMDIIFERQGQ